MNLGLVIIEVCNRNAVNTSSLDAFEEQHPDVAVLHEECLNNCELCALRPFVYVNGKTVTAPTAAGCVERIERFVSKELKAYEDIDSEI